MLSSPDGKVDYELSSFEVMVMFPTCIVLNRKVSEHHDE
jgi:hypothetical protein